MEWVAFWAEQCGSVVQSEKMFIGGADRQTLRGQTNAARGDKIATIKF